LLKTDPQDLYHPNTSLFHPRFSELNDRQKRVIQCIEAGLFQNWELGRNVILNWTLTEAGFVLLVVPCYRLATFLSHSPHSSHAGREENQSPSLKNTPPEHLLKKLAAESRRLIHEDMREVASLLNVEPVVVKLPAPLTGRSVPTEIVDDLVRRYSISYVESCAAILFDIVGFSLYSPIEQVLILNSLAYSINSAHSKLLAQEIDVDFTRSSTGDGFYLWNRAETMQGNINLYHLMQLVLADNTISRSKAKNNIVPLLKTAFHVGSCYEFYPSEKLHPTNDSYIVGDLTIELARIIENTLPGQILVGDFHAKIKLNEHTDAEMVESNTIGFIKQLRYSMSNLHGTRISGQSIKSIECYLTGEKMDNDQFAVSKYSINDKHSKKHSVYNAKVNIYRTEGKPVCLGKQENELQEFQAKRDHVNM
jgi:hypothetical protein